MGYNIEWRQISVNIKKNIKQIDSIYLKYKVKNLLKTTNLQALILNVVHCRRCFTCQAIKLTHRFMRVLIFFYLNEIKRLIFRNTAQRSYSKRYTGNNGHVVSE